MLGHQEVNLSLVSAAPVVWASSHLPLVLAEWFSYGRGQVPVRDTCEESRLPRRVGCPGHHGAELWGPLQPLVPFGTSTSPAPSCLWVLS